MEFFARSPEKKKKEKVNFDFSNQIKKQNREISLSLSFFGKFRDLAAGKDGKVESQEREFPDLEFGNSRIPEFPGLGYNKIFFYDEQMHKDEQRHRVHDWSTTRRVGNFLPSLAGVTS